jgi:K+-transporting ATPase ATPase A chain
VIQRLQGWLPLNPLGMSTGNATANATALKPDLAFNTAVSFMTNTNWQSYAGEVTLS